jgi:hypothetical protein
VAVLVGTAAAVAALQANTITDTRILNVPRGSQLPTRRMELSNSKGITVIRETVKRRIN